MGRWLAFPNIRPDEAEFELMPGIVSHRPQAGPGAMQFLDRGTDYWRIRLRFERLANEEKAAVLAWKAGTRGGALPFYYDDQTQQFSGTLPNTCIIPNPSMDNVAYSSWIQDAVSPRQLKIELSAGRMNAERALGHNGIAVTAAQSAGTALPVSPYGTYAFRMDHMMGRNVSSTGARMIANAAGTTIANRTYLSVNTRYADSLMFGNVASTTIGIAHNVVTHGHQYIIDNYYVHRAPVVDNGENLLSNNTQLSSGTLLGITLSPGDLTIDNSWFPTAGQSPSGARLVESVNSVTHILHVSSIGKSTQEQTWWVRGRVRRGDGPLIRGFRVGFYDNTAGGTGEMAIGVASANALFNQGGGFSETTGWLADLRGNATTSGWYEFGLRTLTNSVDHLRFRMSITSGGGATLTDPYDGDGSSNIGLSDLTIGRGLSYENYRTDYGRLVTTSGTAINSGTSQGQASSLWVKAAPASSNPVAVAGTPFTLNHEFKRLTADFYTDAAGGGIIEFEPPMRNAPLHHAPVIFHRPYGLFKATKPPRIVEEFGVYISMDLELEEVF